MELKIGLCASNFDGAFQFYKFILSWVEFIKCEVFHDNQFLQCVRCWVYIKPLLKTFSSHHRTLV
jgi:hypothetical protein